MAQMTGSRFFAEAMAAYGVSHLFFVPTILYPALAEMEDMDVKRVLTHDEKAAGYMADGYARASRRPGVAMAQNVGAVNLAAGLRDACMAGSPVIAITGEADPDARYRHLYQDVEDFAVFEPLTKFNAHVDKVERLPDLLRQAFREATTGAPGPVHLSIVGKEGSLLERSADLDLVVEDQFLCFPAFRPAAAQEDVERTARVLGQAERPVIVAGGGVTKSDAAAELLELAEKLNAPVVYSLDGKGAIPDNHRLAVGAAGQYSRACANRVLAEADVAFFVGSPAGSQVTNNWKLPSPAARVVQLDINAAELGRNFPLAASLLGDARACLRQLVAAVAQGGPGREAWASRARQIVQEWRSEAETMMASDQVPIRPERLCKELAAALPENAVVVSDTGHSSIWTGTMLDLNHQGQRFLRCAGSLGWAMSAAIGAKCGLPRNPVVAFLGDGGFFYHMAELETAARCGIPVVFVVNNNHSLNQEQRLLEAAYKGNVRGNSGEMWLFRETNYANLARELGCEGIRVERPADIAGALKRALAAGRPAVVDVVTDIHALHARPWAMS